VLGEGKPEFKLKLTDASNSQDGGDWAFIAAQGRRKTLPPSSELPVHNWHDALWLENEEHVE